MKKERYQYKDASDVYIEKEVTGYKEAYEKSKKMKTKKPPIKRTMKLNTDETFKKYPNAFGLDASSQTVKAKDQDANINVAKNKKSIEKTVKSRGLDQSKYKRKK